MVSPRSGKYAKNRQAILAGHRLSGHHPLTRALPDFELDLYGPAEKLDRDQWLQIECVSPSADPWLFGSIEPEPRVVVWPNVRAREPERFWAYLFARIRLHIALNHLDPNHRELTWHVACWASAESIISTIKLGERPARFGPVAVQLPRTGEQGVAAHLAEHGIADELLAWSLGKPGQPFWKFTKSFELTDKLRQQRAANLARGIRAAAAAAIDVAAGVRPAMGAAVRADSVVASARQWIIAEYPLLASLASAFTLIEDEAVCRSMNVQIAAISDESQEIYFNPRISYTSDEARFVMAHEFLHTGLRHSARRQGRDPWLWNVACDFVINDWLIQMKVGVPPSQLGYLFDDSLRGQSAEQVYDLIVRDLRWMRKLRKARTMNGAAPDMLPSRHSPGWWCGDGVDLDTFYRRALTEGLELSLGRGRGYLPAGLVEEIRSLMQPPIPWDVQLGQWLDQYFPPLERRRTFARAHRRQSSTPDIVRAAWVRPHEQHAARVFGAVVDTSGSMSRADLGKALGAIASYAMSRDVGYVRLIQCDAQAHDAGYVEPETLLDRVQVRGRGGTVLMPGIRMIESADDFPDDGPVLIITDGACDRLTVRRDHAYLLAGARLPFQAGGPVFKFSEN